MSFVINFFAGPGAGKSTTATGVFSKLKQAGYKCEYVSEYAKDLVWEGTTALLDNQLHIFAEQHRRQWRLKDKVQFTITDSPLLLSLAYFRYFSEKFPDRHSDEFKKSLEILIKKTFTSEFDNVNIFISRNKPYVELGRSQTEDEAKGIDDVVKDLMSEMMLPHCNVKSTTAVEETLSHLELNGYINLSPTHTPIESKS